MSFLKKLIEQIIKLKEQIKRRRKAVLALCCAVVFVTSYAMVLPAVTMDEQTAAETPGVNLSDTSTTSTSADNSAASDSSKASDEEKAKSSASVEKTEEKNVYTGTLESKVNSGTTVKADVNESASLPEGTELKTEELKDSNYDTALGLAKDKIETDNYSVASAKFYDISFVDSSSDGSDELEPKDDVKVTITFDEGMDVADRDVSVVHIDDDNTTELVDPDKVETEINEGQMREVSFTADSFSVYGVVVSAEEQADSDTSADVDTASDDSTTAGEETKTEDSTPADEEKSADGEKSADEE